MKKFWICVAILGLSYVGALENNNAPDNKDEEYEYYDNDEWYDDISKQDTNSEEKIKAEQYIQENLAYYPKDTNKDPESDLEHDKHVEEEIQENLEKLDAQKSLDDYQFEDNRSEIKDDVNGDKVVEEQQLVQDFVENVPENNEDQRKDIENLVIDDQMKSNMGEISKAKSNVDPDNLDEYDENVLNEYDGDNKEVSEMLKKIDDAADEVLYDDKIIDDQMPEPVEINLNIKANNQEMNNDKSHDKIIEETKKILSEMDNAFEDDTYQNLKIINENLNQKPGKPTTIKHENVPDVNEHNVKQLGINLFSEYSVKNVDINKDQIEESKKEIKNVVNDSENKKTEVQNSDKALETGQLAEDIQVPDVPEQENDRESEKQTFDNLLNELNDEQNSADVIMQQVNDDYEKIEDSNLDEIFSEKEVDNKDDQFDVLNVNVDEIGKIFEEKSIPREALRSNLSKLTINVENEEEKGIPKEALRSSTTPKTSANQDDAVFKDRTKFNTFAQNFNEKQTTLSVDSLSSVELDNLMRDFEILHAEEIKSDNARGSAPIHIKINPDTPVELTSPNYPGNYPTNNVVEWILDGEGRGIELNITHFAVNGALGDYVLVKPGGIETSPEDSIVFSYRLNSERRYRFVDANSLYVKFESKQGMPFLDGFHFSIKMLRPPAEPVIVEPEPESNHGLPQVKHTFSVYLQGLTPDEFLTVKEDVRLIIADMATMYINAMKIPLGLNTTSQITQIVRHGLCKKSWPDFEFCVHVQFAVPLVYEDNPDVSEADPEVSRLNESDLKIMWSKYVQVDPFFSRLERLGLEKYQNPDNRSVLLSWMLVAFGVILLAALVSIGLWRFSCFEKYTRMPVYSDTDSIQNEKRGLDLYPTPHQTLPPLYSHQDYPWEKYDDATRVDMGGFTNKSYVREDLFDIESDEEVANHNPRDRYTTDV